MGDHEESNTKETLMHNNINKDENSWGNANKRHSGMLKCYMKTLKFQNKLKYFDCENVKVRIIIQQNYHFCFLIEKKRPIEFVIPCYC
jgi:hypothetical protein